MLKNFRKEYGNAEITVDKNEKLHKWVQRMVNMEAQGIIPKFSLTNGFNVAYT